MGRNEWIRIDRTLDKMRGETRNENNNNARMRKKRNGGERECRINERKQQKDKHLL